MTVLAREQVQGTITRVRDIDQAVDLYLESIEGKRRPRTVRKYQELLFPFAKAFEDKHPCEITTRDLRIYLQRYREHSAATRALHETVICNLFGFLFHEEIIESDPSARLERTRRQKPEDVHVVSVDEEDVFALIAAVRDPDEAICFALLVYLGPRRSAAAFLRRSDIDLNAGLIRFREKGGKEIYKPIPRELAVLIHDGDEIGLWPDPDDYLIPNRRAPRRKNERSDKVVYRIVKDVAARAGVAVHPHALRAAFATRFAEQFPGQDDALRELMGHESFDTTRVYLRRQDKLKLMRQVEGLSWGSSGFSPDREVKGYPRTAETAAGADSAETRATGESAPETGPAGLPDPLRSKLGQLRANSERDVRP